jgi:hypothetical protein
VADVVRSVAPFLIATIKADQVMMLLFAFALLWNEFLGLVTLIDLSCRIF